jgi:hypothetical protein
MKKAFLSFTVLLFMSLFSNIAFAQPAPGDDGLGGGDGGSVDGGGAVIPAQPLAFHFTRNNGDGTCGG